MNSRRGISLFVLLGIATAFGVSSTIQAYYLAHARGMNEPMTIQLFILDTVYWYVPALLAPIIIKVATRYQVGRTPWYALIGIHVTGALTYSVVHTSAMLATRALLMD